MYKLYSPHFLCLLINLVIIFKLVAGFLSGYARLVTEIWRSSVVRKIKFQLKKEIKKTLFALRLTKAAKKKPCHLILNTSLRCCAIYRAVKSVKKE